MRAITYMNTIRKNVAEGNQFRGYNRQIFGSPNTFWDMKNMSGVDAPLIRTRDRRHKMRTIGKFNGMFGREALGWVDGETLYYDGETVGKVEDSPKRFVHMGAYTLIMPDKKLLNTSTLEVLNVENRAEMTGEITYTPCDKLGEKAEWESAVYVKIEAEGIGTGFKSGDVVTVSGSAVENLNGDMQLDTVTEDSIILLGVMYEESMSQEGGLKLERTMPDMDYMTECKNRIWGCSSKNHEVYACKLGDPTNWKNYQGLANDAYALTVGSIGDFTGATSHLGYVLFFKEHMIHKLFGDRPSNYQLTDTHARGVQQGSADSLCTINETLYYMSTEGVVAYEGALPGDVGEALGNVRYYNARAGSAKGRMWMCMEDNEQENHLFTLDAKTGAWHKEDNVRVLAFARTGEHLYMVDGEGNLWCLTGHGDMEYEDETAAWEGTRMFTLETGYLNMMDLYRKRMQKIMIRLEVDMGGACEVDVQYDDGAWQMVQRIEAGQSKRSLALPMVPRRCDRMKIRIHGYGMMRLYNLNLITTGGSEIG